MLFAVAVDVESIVVAIVVGDISDFLRHIGIYIGRESEQLAVNEHIVVHSVGIGICLIEIHVVDAPNEILLPEVVSVFIPPELWVARRSAELFGRLISDNRLQESRIVVIVLSGGVHHEASVFGRGERLGLRVIVHDQLVGQGVAFVIVLEFLIPLLAIGCAAEEYIVVVLINDAEELLLPECDFIALDSAFHHIVFGV